MRTDDALKAAALAYLNDSDYVTTWSLSNPERDEDSPECCTIIAQDCGHHSNVIVLEMRGLDVECAG